MNTYQFTVDRTVASAKLNVYLTGTTTAATFYTDAAGTSAGTSPVIADSAGQFAPIYLDPSITYRIKVTNNAGSTTYYDIDPVSLTDEGTADGVLMVRSVDDATKRKIPANVSAVYCAGHADKNDRGQALYVRVASAPAHAGKFTSADGAFWELSENVLNPFMFGAKGDNAANDSPAIQAMFDFVTTKGRPYPINFMGAKFYVHDALLLPKYGQFTTLDIDGGGANLRTDQAITILSCPVPATQSAADVAIGQNAFDIHHLNFEGNNTAGQIGVHLLATYTSVVHSCYFQQLDYGTIGTFCIASAWRDNRYLLCAKRAAVVQAADSFLTGSLVWTGATTSNSGCNVSVFENCRVAGHASQTSAFGIFGSDAVRMNGCISEGAGANYDVHFDYQAATTIKEFNIHTFHCEAPNGKLNFKIRAAGQVVIDTVVLQYPAAILDAAGSNDAEFIIRGINYLGNPPVPNGLPYNAVTNPNPNGRWFYHVDGNGFGAATEVAGNSSGSIFRFEDCFDSAYLQFGNAAHWEGGTLPWSAVVRGRQSANAGVQEWASGPIGFRSTIYLGDGSTLAGMPTGNITSSTTSVAANSSVTESFTVTGLKRFHHTVFVNPYNNAYVPPAGIVWNAWLDADDLVKIRYTNVTGSAITLTTNAMWRYCAPKQN